MSSEEKSGGPIPTGYNVQNTGYQQQQLNGNQPQPQQFPASPPYTNKHHGGEYSRITEEEGEGKGGDEEGTDHDDIPGRGPGGVPQKYFALDFEDCFTEHKNTKTIPIIYKVIGLVFKYTKLVFYHIFVILVGIPLAIIWAITNGIAAFVLVWMWGPLLRHIIVWAYAVMPAITIPWRAFFGPLVDLHARVFRQIRVKVDVNGTLGRKLAGQEHTA